MNDLDNSNQEERYIKTKESIIDNLRSQKEIEKQYLMTVDNLLGYWIDELGKTKSKNKEMQDKLIKLINTERGTIDKIKYDINQLNERIDQTEENLEKIKKMVYSLRKETQ